MAKSGYFQRRFFGPYNKGDFVESQDFYAILRVPRDATAQEIRKAYWAIASACHPDKVGNDPDAVARFQAASKAYEVLSDPHKRLRYDRGFAPIASVRDLFFRHPAGQRVLRTLLPTAPAAPQKGIDLLQTVAVPPNVLRDGGVHVVGNIVLTVPPGAEETAWCRIQGLGAPGKNGAECGDLVIHLKPNTKGRNA